MQTYKHQLALIIGASALTGGAIPVLAEQSTFVGSPDENWFASRNWSSGVVPNAGTNVLIDSGLVTIGRRGAVSGPITVEGSGGLGFEDDGSAENLEINVNHSTGTPPVNLVFVDGSSASNSKIFLNSGAMAGFLDATAGDSEITISDGSLFFIGRSTAGSSTIYNNSGVVSFIGGWEAANGMGHPTIGEATIVNGKDGLLTLTTQASADAATIVNETGATIAVLTLDGTRLSVGSISGAGNISIGPQGLSLGALNRNDVISGIIHDSKLKTATQSIGSITSHGLHKIGEGTLSLTGSNTYTGGTSVNAGTLSLGDGGTSGSVLGNIRNDGILQFNRADELTFPGSMSGRGDVWQVGRGKTTLSGENTYLGNTVIASGTLALGSENSISPHSKAVVGTRGSLALNSFDQAIRGLENHGIVSFGATSGTTLTIHGDYVGHGGIIEMKADIGSEEGRSDLLKIEGDATGTGTLSVSKDTRKGDAVKTEVKLVEISGASNASFTLNGNYKIEGVPALISGPYVYQLHKGALENPANGDWYLRSDASTIGHPASNGRGSAYYQPGVPVYETYALSLLGLNGLSTFQERTANRTWGRDFYENPSSNSPGIFTGVWTKFEGWHSHGANEGSQTGVEFDQDAFRMQVGIDGRLAETGYGSLHFSAAGHLIDGRTDTSSAFDAEHRGGRIDTTGYGFSGALTWWGDNNFYIDAQGQATWYKSKLGYNGGLDTLSDRNDSFGYTASIEGGFHVHISDNLTLIPQAQLTYSHLRIDGFDDTFGAEVNFNRGESLQGRIGLVISRDETWEAENGSTSRIDTYGISNFYHEFLNHTQTDVSTVAFENETDRMWAGLGAGGSYSWNDDRFAIYGEGLIKTSLENPGKSYTLSGKIGFRANF